MLKPVLWMHGEAMGPANPALVAHPGAPAVFVFDRELIVQAGLSLKRLGFLYECLLELPVTLRHGDVAEEVLAFARRHGADGVVTTAAVDPRFAQLRERIAAQLPVQVLEPAPFVELPEPVDLRALGAGFSSRSSCSSTALGSLSRSGCSSSG
ncbi:MAG: hypothetical protein NTX18_04505 [Cyanobium sp. LacPavin_0818_WC50_MAG_67_9]|nr:hypothetical protein [Cyanobium sp. LacPavin_0818_WC50_MAG_67_9]